MPRSYQRSFLSSAAPNPCHPERSLAMSEANRQTQSKDLAPVGPTEGDARRSHSKAWTISILMMAFLLLSVVSFSQTTRRFPGKESELISPDRHWTVQNVDRDQEPHHSILLKDNITGKTRKLSDYERGVGAVWSPDNHHLALNYYAGSDFTETAILSVDETIPKIDVQEAILPKIDIPDCDHCYFGVSRWLDDRRVVVHAWGYGNRSSLFCLCYIYTLSGSTTKCIRQPKPDGDVCETLTP